jgi:glycosyltransferase involved in cell wall biosynthesis
VRAVFVNYCHPQTKHVCAIRVSSFAEALARKGHQIILLTRSLDESDVPKEPEDVRQELKAHDWSAPYNLACPPVHDNILSTLRAGKLPGGIRQACIGWFFASKGGVFADWTQGSKKYWGVISEDFRPEVTWGTFASTDAWHIAQGIANQTGCPWIMDAKDPWDKFVPKGLRRYLAKRYEDAVCMTTICRDYATTMNVWFTHRKTAVYSGFPLSYLTRKAQGDGGTNFRISLHGSLYSVKNTRAFFQGITAWLGQLSPDERTRVTFIYAGGSWQEVEREAVKISDLCCVIINKFLPPLDLNNLLMSSDANVYLTHPDNLFHHKIFELLCSRRPIICFPGETEEVRQIVSRVRGTLYSCNSEAEVSDALGRLWREKHAGEEYGIDKTALEAFSWERQADSLLEVFSSVVEG